MEEIWKDIEGYKGFYKVSNLGNIKSLPRNGTVNEERIIKPCKNNNGYVKIGLNKEGIIKYKTIHRIVAESFIPNPNNLEQVNHINGNKEDNRVDNLEWCTQSENIKHCMNVLGKMKRKVMKIDTKTNKIIQTFDSTVEAMKETGIDRTNITRCCNGKLVTAGGYIWKYKE